MGHKAHPVGLRLGLHRKWKSNWYFESSNYTKLMHLSLNIEKFITGFLYFLKLRKTLVLKCQLVKLPSNKLFVFVFYYRFRKKWKKTILKSRNEVLWKENLQNFLNTKKNYKINYFKALTVHTLNTNKFLDINKKKYLKNYLIFLNTNTYKLNSNFLIILNNMFIKKFLNYFKLVKFFQNNFQFFTKKNLNIILNNLNHFFNNLKHLLLKILILKNNMKLLKNEFNLITFFFNFKIFNNKFCKIKKNYTVFFKTLIFKKLNNLNLSLNYFKTFFNKIKLKLKKNIIKHFKYLTFVQKNLQIKKKKKYLKYKFIYNKKTKNLKIIIIKPTLRWKKYLKSSSIKKEIFKFNHPISTIKKFLSKITNIKFNLIFINTLSFAKFFYLIQENIRKIKKERFNVIQIQRMMLNRYKYNAIFIKDFIHLAFITILLKNPTPLVKFIGEQFKRLPKNRKQLKLLKFINQSLQIFCKQREEILGFKFQIYGRLNRRRRTHKWNFQKGILKLQTYETRVEYGYSEGFTRRGLIGLHFWIFYNNAFNKILKNKLLQYLFYSKYKLFINQSFLKEKQKNNKLFNNNLKKFTKKHVKTKSKKISKK